MLIAHCSLLSSRRRLPPSWPPPSAGWMWGLSGCLTCSIHFPVETATPGGYLRCGTASVCCCQACGRLSARDCWSRLEWHNWNIYSSYFLYVWRATCEELLGMLSSDLAPNPGVKVQEFEWKDASVCPLIARHTGVEHWYHLTWVRVPVCGQTWQCPERVKKSKV